LAVIGNYKYNWEAELTGTGSRSYTHWLSQFCSNLFFYLCYGHS